jgi:hypothetical protein
MKTKLFAALVGMLALSGAAHAEEGKKKEKKAIDPAILEKYDKNKDGQLSKEEKAEMKKDKAAEPKKIKEPKAPKPPKEGKKAKETVEPKEATTETPPKN